MDVFRGYFIKNSKRGGELLKAIIDKAEENYKALRGVTLGAEENYKATKREGEGSTLGAGGATGSPSEKNCYRLKNGIGAKTGHGPWPTGFLTTILQK